jgi:hypothetical protein
MLRTAFLSWPLIVSNAARKALMKAHIPKLPTTIVEHFAHLGGPYLHCLCLLDIFTGMYVLEDA